MPARDRNSTAGADGRLGVLTKVPRCDVLFVEQPREQFGRCDALARAAAADEPEELRAIRVRPPAHDRLEDPLARAGQVLPALLVYDCREVQRLRNAGAVGAVELFVERLGDRGLGLGLLPALYRLVPGDLGSASANFSSQAGCHLAPASSLASASETSAGRDETPPPIAACMGCLISFDGCPSFTRVKALG